MMKVKFGGLSAELTDAKMINEFGHLDHNGDGLLSLEDTDELQGEAKEQALKEMARLVSFLGKIDEGKAESNHPGPRRVWRPWKSREKAPVDPKPVQEYLATRIIELEGKVNQLDQIVRRWKKEHIDRWGWEMEFNADNFEAVAREWKEVPILQPDAFNQLGEDIRDLIFELADANLGILPAFFSGAVNCNGGVYTTGFEYDENAVPEEWRYRVRALAENYVQSSNWIGEYAEIECEDWWLFWWGNCPEGSKIILKKLAAPSFIKAGRTNENSAFVASCNACFSGDTHLQTKTGVIRFDELKALWHAKKPLPEVASFDEETGEVIWQSPTLLVEHAGVHSAWFI